MMKGQCLYLDIISSLPPNIIESILCLVPIQEAGRTSILSKEWRYKWTTIPKLDFNHFKFRYKWTRISRHDFYHFKFQLSTDKHQSSGPYLSLYKRSKLFNAMNQVLLLHQGPIVEFSVDDTCVEIDQIILHLSSQDTLKNVPFIFSYPGVYRLPLYIFSLHQLTHIYLDQCELDHQPTFNGFSNLTNLYLDNFICEGNIPGNDRSTITKIFECLPMIEHLFISQSTTRCFAQGGVPRVLPTPLVHLKSFSLVDLCFFDEYGLPFLALVLRSSPNLEKLNLAISHHSSIDKSEIDSFKLEDYSDIWFEHLKELGIYNFGKLKNELEFLKVMLGKSPVLKHVLLVLNDKVSKGEKLLILDTLLLRALRAAPLVRIFVKHIPQVNGEAKYVLKYWC